MRNILLTLFIVLSLNANAEDLVLLVNMSYQEQIAAFNPNTDFIDVAGTFNNWEGGVNYTFAKTSTDSIYELKIQALNLNETIEFKCRINGEWNGLEEFAGGGSNRVYTILGNDTLRFWYSDLTPPTGPAVANFNLASNIIFAGTEISFNNASTGLIENIQWYFPGGIPSTSNDFSPTVLYTDTGEYDVTLIASNNFSSDTFKAEKLVKVIEKSNDDLEWWNDVVFYEIFVRSFYDSDGDGIGDFNGITEKLDYLNDGDSATKDDLGIGGIWLMPIHESPSYHGYDVIDYNSVNPDYGTMEDFKNLVNEAHKRGIKIIIDFVMNHSSRDHPWFKSSASSKQSPYRDYYVWEDNNPGFGGPWGQSVWHQSNGDYYYGIFWDGMPDLNYNNPDVKDSIFNSADFWLNDVGIDGFRLDAVKYIYEEGNQLENLPKTINFFKEFNARIKSQNPNAFAVGEAWDRTSVVVPYVLDNAIDFCFDFDLASSILSSVKSSNASSTENQIKNSISSYPHYQFSTFLTNHDQDRLFEVLSENIDRNKVAASIYLTLPGIPFLYYGEEIAMLGKKPDENIRRPFQWSDGNHAGFTEGSPWRAPNFNFRDFNVEVFSEDPESILNTYRNLIQTRNSYPSLRTGDFKLIDDLDNSILAYSRSNAEESIVVLNNLSSSDKSIDNLNIADLKADLGDNFLIDILTGEDFSAYLSSDGLELLNFTLSPYRTYLLTFSSESSFVPQSQNIKIYPNPTQGKLYFSFPENSSYYDNVKVKIYNSQGQNILEYKGYVFTSNNSIDFDYLRNGYYFIEIESANQKIVQRFIKN